METLKSIFEIILVLSFWGFLVSAIFVNTQLLRRLGSNIETWRELEDVNHRLNNLEYKLSEILSYFKK